MSDSIPSNLVAEIRDLQDPRIQWGAITIASAASLLPKAANELERLYQENGELNDLYIAEGLKRRAAEDKNKNLRDALALACKYLRRWRRRDSDLKLPYDGPDPKLFSASGWFCSRVENDEFPVQPLNEGAAVETTGEQK